MAPRRDFHADELRSIGTTNGYGDKGTDNLVWLLCDYLPGYCNDDRLSLQLELAVDWSTVARIANGSYPGDPGPVLTRIARLRRNHDLRPGGGLIETCVVHEIWKVLDFSLARRAVTMIWGDTGRSKTHAVRAWAREHHTEALYVEVGTIGGLPMLMKAILEACGKQKDFTHDMSVCKTAVEANLHGRVLILDEVARLFRGERQKVVKRLDWIRELHDRLGIGICFVATEDFVTTLQLGKLKKYLEQLVGRIADILKIPKAVSWQESTEIADAISATPSADLVDVCHQIANGDEGHIRTLLKHVVPDALLLARAENREISAEDILAVYEDRDGDKRLPAA